jgi:hypothetical protein
MSYTESRQLSSECIGRRSDWKFATDHFKSKDIHQEDFEKEICVCVGKSGLVKPCDLSVWNGEKCRALAQKGKVVITSDIYRWLFNGYSKQETMKSIYEKLKYHPSNKTEDEE